MPRTSDQVFDTLNNHWADLRTQMGTDWAGFVVVCQQGLAEYREDGDAERLAARLIWALADTYEGQSALVNWGLVGVMFSDYTPRDSHPTEGVKNSLDELAKKVAQETPQEPPPTGSTPPPVSSD